MNWQPIETIPKDGTKILVFTVHGDIEITEWCVMKNSHYEEADNGLYRKIIDAPTEFWNGSKPIYWMPLPEVPIEAKDDVLQAEMGKMRIE